jgi:hypothetical protein
MILVSNCAHDNGIYTYINEVTGLVIKSSYSPEGITRLEQERVGYEWYFRLGGLLGVEPLSMSKNKAGSYGRLKVRRFPGHSGNSYGSLSGNRDDLLAAVAFYSRVWPRLADGLAPMHGDFSLGNMIFHDDQISLVDWEHFRPDGVPWGMDLLNLLYESVTYSLHGRNTLTPKDERVFREVRRVIASLLATRGDLAASFETVHSFVSDNRSIWGGLVGKLPITNLTPSQRDFVNRLDGSA